MGGAFGGRASEDMHEAGESETEREKGRQWCADRHVKYPTKKEHVNNNLH